MTRDQSKRERTLTRIAEVITAQHTSGLCPLDGPCAACDCFDPQHRRERDEARAVLDEIWPAETTDTWTVAVTVPTADVGEERAAIERAAQRILAWHLDPDPDDDLGARIAGLFDALGQPIASGGAS